MSFELLRLRLWSQHGFEGSTVAVVQYRRPRKWLTKRRRNLRRVPRRLLRARARCPLMIRRWATHRVKQRVRIGVASAVGIQ